MDPSQVPKDRQLQIQRRSGHNLIPGSMLAIACIDKLTRRLFCTE